MKQLKLLIVPICILSILLTSVLLVFAAENNLDICDHNYKFDYIKGDCFVYTCTECCDKDEIKFSDVKALWSIDAVNKHINSVDYGYVLDVVPDGIINAKDFAKLNHIYNFGY